MLLACVLLSALYCPAQKNWSVDKANKWYKQQQWPVGCNYIPANAVNPIEMWQSETFDTATIDKELALAHATGFNTLRVFLHETVYRYDSIGYKNRIRKFLEIAARHQLKVIFALFDDCWFHEPKPGAQPLPRPGVHNSEWVQCPGKKDVYHRRRWCDLEKYTTDIVRTFGMDDRVLMWDLYNEPGNSFLLWRTNPLLSSVFKWARTAEPQQPLTSGVYSITACKRVQLKNSDVITFHNYADTGNMKRQIKQLKKSGRPVICTEYMARSAGSTFQTHLPLLAAENVGAINWGLVKGKTQTIYPWSTWVKPAKTEPVLWFHDLYYEDYRPYSKPEIDLIKDIAGKHTHF
jgi:hypothetical protein